MRVPEGEVHIHASLFLAEIANTLISFDGRFEMRMTFRCDVGLKLSLPLSLFSFNRTSHHRRHRRRRSTDFQFSPAASRHRS
jgi:hypothetical protein